MNLNTPMNLGPESSAAVLPSLPSAPGHAKLRPSLRVQILRCGIVAGIALASYLLITHFLVQPVQVLGTSMAPTLKNTDRYLLNRLVFSVRDPQPSEIVVFRDPSDQGYSVKRIVAREGDTVCVRGGHLYVNGRELAEAYLPPGVGTFMPIVDQRGCWVCRKGEYFVLGDNRGNSTDSRDYGIVPRQNILGTIIR